MPVEKMTPTQKSKALSLLLSELVSCLHVFCVFCCCCCCCCCCCWRAHACHLRRPLMMRNPRRHRRHRPMGPRRQIPLPTLLPLPFPFTFVLSWCGAPILQYQAWWEKPSGDQWQSHEELVGSMGPSPNPWVCAFPAAGPGLVGNVGPVRMAGPCACGRSSLGVLTACMCSFLNFDVLAGLPRCTAACTAGLGPGA